MAMAKGGVRLKGQAYRAGRLKSTIAHAQRMRPRSLIVALVVRIVALATAAPAFPRLHGRLAVGGEFVQVSLETLAAVAAGLVGGAEFLEVVATCAAQAAVMPAAAFFGALGVIGVAQDPPRMRFAGNDGQADKAGENNGCFSHDLSRTSWIGVSVATVLVTHLGAIGCTVVSERLRWGDMPINRAFGEPEG
jgi:hypothetical protein